MERFTVVLTNNTAIPAVAYNMIEALNFFIDTYGIDNILSITRVK